MTRSYKVNMFTPKERKIYLIMDRKDEENILVQDENRPDTCVQSRFLGNALYEASLTGRDTIEKSLFKF